MWLKQRETRLRKKVAELRAQLEQVTKEREASDRLADDLKSDIQKLQGLLEEAQKRTTSGALSPRGQRVEPGSLPLWKIRQMEKEKEEEEKRAQESARKLVKASSIKVKQKDVIQQPEPIVVRQPVQSELEEKPQFKPSSVVNEMSQAELEAAEEARLMRGLMRAVPGTKK